MSKLSFSEHPAAVGETYLEHMGVATGFGFSMIVGGLACLVHGILPFAFTSTGSRSSSASAVGTIAPPCRTNRSSPKWPRRRRSAMLTPGCVSPNARAAPDTLPCENSASRTRSRFRSSGGISWAYTGYKQDMRCL